MLVQMQADALQVEVIYTSTSAHIDSAHLFDSLCSAVSSDSYDEQEHESLAHLE
jgi:hypothetical protein